MDEPVLVIVEVAQVLDAEKFGEYQRLAREQIKTLGGSVVARGGHLVEGLPEFAGVMIQQWSSERDFLAWQQSVEYQPLKSLRLQCVVLRIAVVPMVSAPVQTSH